MLTCLLYAGYNQHGQLGSGLYSSAITPVRVFGAHTFTRISAGYLHTCGIDVVGAAWCWGE